MASLYFIIFFMLIATQEGHSHQGHPPLQEPIQLQADSITHDQEAQLIRAYGRVQASYENKKLLADSLIYHEKEDLLIAVGHVHFWEPSGNLMRLDYIELTGHMKEGILKKIRMLLKDDARLVAKRGLYKNSDKNILEEVIYSPCKLCPPSQKCPPLWQLKAQSAIQDKKNQDIIYHHAWLEMQGVPILYMPYLRHPDPKVKRRSGFLTPRWGSTSDFGAWLATPYYYPLARDKDLLLTPYLTTKEGVIAYSRYRQRIQDGRFSLEGSITKSQRKKDNKSLVDTKRKWRWHFLANGKFEINDEWRWGFDAKRASDQTYLKRYRFFGLENKESLVTEGYIEGLYPHQYISMHTYAFQGLGEEFKSRTLPFIIPVINHHYFSDPKSFGFRVFLNNNLLNIKRRSGTDTARVITEGGIHLPGINSIGLLYNLTASIRGDFYYIRKLDDDNPDLLGELYEETTKEKAISRFIPKLGLETRLPFIRMFGTSHIILTPIFHAWMIPRQRNSKHFSNEDSAIFEFDDTNLFSASRFAGFDIVDEGARIDYGIEAKYLHPSGSEVMLLVGQTYSHRISPFYPLGSGLQKRSSDYVGQLQVTFEPFIELTQKFRLDKARFRIQRNDSSLKLGTEKKYLKVEYIYVDKSAFKNTAYQHSLKQYTISVRYDIMGGWLVNGGYTKNLSPRKQRLSQYIGIQYSDECFALEGQVRRLFHQDRDLKPATELIIIFRFKNLGESITKKSWGDKLTLPMAF